VFDMTFFNSTLVYQIRVLLRAGLAPGWSLRVSVVGKYRKSI